MPDSRRPPAAAQPGGRLTENAGLQKFPSASAREGAGQTRRFTIVTRFLRYFQCRSGNPGESSRTLTESGKDGVRQGSARGVGKKQSAFRFHQNAIRRPRRRVGPAATAGQSSGRCTRNCFADPAHPTRRRTEEVRERGFRPQLNQVQGRVTGRGSSRRSIRAAGAAARFRRAGHAGLLIKTGARFVSRKPTEAFSSGGHRQGDSQAANGGAQARRQAGADLVRFSFFF